MPGFTEPVRSTGERRGLFLHLRRITANFFQHLQALGDLFGLESRSATRRGFRALIAVGAALFFAAFGYLLFFLFLAFLLALVCHIQWWTIALIFALLHFALAGGLVLWARSQFAEPFFPATAAELRKDFESLKGDQP